MPCCTLWRRLHLRSQRDAGRRGRRNQRGKTRYVEVLDDSGTDDRDRAGLKTRRRAASFRPRCRQVEASTPLLKLRWLSPVMNNLFLKGQGYGT